MFANGYKSIVKVECHYAILGNNPLFDEICPTSWLFVCDFILRIEKLSIRCISNVLW